LVHHSLGTFVQKIVQYAGRYIAIDFFLPERKIRVINIYNFQKNQWDRSSHSIPSGSAFSQYVIQQIKEGESQGFTIITMGDFNLDPSINFLA